MRALVLTLLAPLLLTGCLVQSHGHGHGSRSSARVRSCPPAHHWNGAACVHNGKAKGHHKGHGNH